MLLSSTLTAGLVLSVLCAPHPSRSSSSSSSLCLRLSSPYQTDAQELLCGNSNHIYRAALPPRRRGSSGGLGGGDDYWDSVFRSSAEFLSSSSSESRERRTSPGPPAPATYRFLSQTKLRSKTLQQQNSLRGGGGGGERRSKFTLSLDVPTNIMNVLFDIAKAKSLRAKAADNARLLAQIGRRK